MAIIFAIFCLEDGARRLLDGFAYGTPQSGYGLWAIGDEVRGYRFSYSQQAAREIL